MKNCIRTTNGFVKGNLRICSFLLLLLSFGSVQARFTPSFSTTSNAVNDSLCQSSITNNSGSTILNCTTTSISLTATGNAISENFNNGVWNTSNFTLGAPSIGNGSVVNGAYADPSS